MNDRTQMMESFPETAAPQGPYPSQPVAGYQQQHAAQGYPHQQQQQQPHYPNQAHGYAQQQQQQQQQQAPQGYPQQQPPQGYAPQQPAPGYPQQQPAPQGYPMQPGQPQQAAPAYQSPAQAGLPAPGQKKKSALPRILIGGAVAGGGALALVLVLGGGGGPGALPCALGKLPSETHSLARATAASDLVRRTGVAAADVPEQARWSLYADELCGGEDVFRRLLSASASYARESLSLAMMKKDELKASLACGKEIATAVGAKAAAYEVRFDKGHVLLMPASFERLSARPARVVDTTIGGASVAYCVLPSGAAAGSTCDDKNTGLMKLRGENLWASADVGTLKSFASAFSSSGSNSQADGQKLEALARSLADFERVSVGLGARFDGPPLHFAAPKELEEKLESAGKGGAKVFGFGASGGATGGKTRYEVWAKDDASATAIGDALRACVKATVEKNKEAEAKEAADKPDPNDKTAAELRELAKVTRAMERRALAAAEVKVSGDKVELVVAIEPSGDEKGKIEAALAKNKERAAQAARVVDKMAAGDMPDEADLSALGGKELVDAIKNPKPPAPPAPPPPPAESAAYVAVPGGAGFKVPAGGTYRATSVSGTTWNEYTYSGSMEATFGAFIDGVSAAGFSITKDEAASKGVLVYKCTRGSTLVVVMVSKDTSGQLVLSMMVR